MLGRWISRDRIGERGGVNLYAYVENCPVLFTDPTGLQSMGCRSVVNIILKQPEEAWPENAPDTTCFYGKDAFDKAEKHSKSSCCPLGKHHQIWCIVGTPTVGTPGWCPPLNPDGSVQDPFGAFSQYPPRYDYAAQVKGGWAGGAGHPSPQRGSAAGIGARPRPKKGQNGMCCDTCVKN